MTFAGPTAEPAKIPLTIGFTNLAGDDLGAMASEDVAALAPLFARSRVVPPHELAGAEVLFVYAHLNEDGTIKGPARSDIRQVAQRGNAAIVVLASPNSAASIQNAAALPGPKAANIVLTLNRNGSGFGRFFRELFEKMRDGKHMPAAWVDLAPQHPQANPSYAPSTIFLAEGGKIAFPRHAEVDGADAVSPVVDERNYAALFLEDRLREIARASAAPVMMGFVLETHSGSEKHSDVVAVYHDKLRIYPSSGQLWLYDGYNASLNNLLRECLVRAAQASKALPALGYARPARLRPSSFTVSYLWTDGLRVEKGAQEALAAHPAAAALVKDADGFKRLFQSMPQSQAGQAVMDMIGNATGGRAKAKAWSARDMTALGVVFFVCGLFVTGSYASASVPLMVAGVLLALIGAYLWRFKR